MKSAAWGALCVLVVGVVLVEAGPYLRADEIAFIPYLENRFSLFVHVFGGSVALLVGPLQLMPAVREHSPLLHRRLGGLYLAGIGVGSLGSVSLAFNSAVGWTVGASLLTLTGFWIITSAVALAAVRNGRLTEHRRWAIRSFVLTFGFVTFRLMGALPIYPLSATVLERTTTAVWLSWVVPLFATELAFSWRSGRSGGTRGLSDEEAPARGAGS
jgi:uncharacterized membrane protein